MEYLIRSSWLKIRIQQQNQIQKAHKHMEIEQCSPESSVGQGRNKERNKILSKIQWKWPHNIPKLNGHMKVVLRGKYIALNAYIKKLEKSHTSELTEHLKTLEEKEANSPGGLDSRK